MSNNDVFKKLRVALKLRDDDIVAILKLVDFNISKSELGAFFRSEDHPKYMDCGDQILRNFLNGLVIHLRGTKENPKNPGDVLPKTKTSTPAQKKPGFKAQQLKRINKDISPVKYKNKGRQGQKGKES